MPEYTFITNRLIECRQKMGISKNEAAKRIGVSQPAYLRYESGERTPSMQVIKEIAKVLHTSPGYLIGKTNSSDIDAYVITKEDDFELFSIIETYYRSEEKQQRRLLAYLKEFLKTVSN